MKEIFLIIFAFVLNLPFGYYRDTVRKFSIAWILAIHLPVLVVVPIRLFLVQSEISAWIMIPIIIAAAVLGQFVGARVHRRRKVSSDTGV